MNHYFRVRPIYVILAFVLLFTAACGPLPAVLPGPQATQPEPTVPAPVSPTTTEPATAPAATVRPTAVVTGTVQIDATSPMTETTLPQGGEMMTDRTLTPTPVSTPAMTVIRGQVTYRERIALQPGAVVEVELQDISRADAPATVVSKQRIETQGQQVPIPFAVQYNLSSIDPAGLYSLRAHIIEGGLVTWLTTDAPRVIARGAPTDQVEIIVQQSNNPQPAAP